MSRSTRRAFLARSLALGIPALGVPLASCRPDVDLGQEPKPAPAGAGTARKFRGRIVIATIENPSQAARQSLARAYNKHQPDVEIVWDTTGYVQDDHYADPDTYATWLTEQLRAEPIRPDIVSGNYARTFDRYVDLDEYRAQVNPYTGNRWDADYDFTRSNEVNERGERTLIGSNAGHVLWVYNRDIFSDLDIDPPTTWPEFVDVCERLQRAQLQPISTSFDYALPTWLGPAYFDQFHDAWIESVRAQPGDWNWDPELDEKFVHDPTNPRIHATYTFSWQRFYAGLRNGDLRFDTPEMLDLVTNLAQVFPRYAGPDFFVPGEPYAAFLRGDAAMMVDGLWVLPTLAQDLTELSPERSLELGVEPESVQPFEWDVFELLPMQGVDARTDVRAPEDLAGNLVSVVDKGPVHNEMVMDFLMFWFSEPGFSAYMQGEIDAGELYPQGPPLVAGVEYPADLAELFSGVEPRGVMRARYADFWLNGAGGRTSRDLRTLFARFLRGEMSARQYVVRLQRYVQRNFGRFLQLARLTQDDIDSPARRPATV
ncbi:MAG TPA: extracellular solute-binding protein [Actinopolymorphaceae bacterium]